MMSRPLCLKDWSKGLNFGLALSTYEKDRLLHLLKLYLDIFACSCGDMVDLSFITHYMLLVPHARPL